ncbi:uracil-DNA glycosylase [Fructobacillus ficulneus]|uniref:Uracil-DNA glycosylase n=1 Tax=Fructobacillus ficulneus TaxID=157463 RepID=A0A0K8MI35_9LACO|nr:uracil-DNA glycosylase [Fructobacillus ficulneus]GAP00108.1 uracil-DNA glycosylase [Fructobacillus ficulneus]
MANFSLTNSDWDSALAAFLPDDYQYQAEDFLAEVYDSNMVTYPSQENVFAALQKTPLDQTKVVILGQDPYHGPDQAQGLAFSVPDDTPVPPSLRNILKELASDSGHERLSHDLSSWADQGVLLLNTVLTVSAGQANSHQGLIWEKLTDAVIQAANADDQPKVFIFWGKPAQKKASLIDKNKHLVLQAPHPSPLAAYRGFFGSAPFSQTNRFLRDHQRPEIDWLN